MSNLSLSKPNTVAVTASRAFSSMSWRTRLCCTTLLALGLTLACFTAAHAQSAATPAQAATAPSSMALTTAPALANVPAATEVKSDAAVADNPYGLGAMWSQGDWVAKITVLLLIIMSLASWYVLISKLMAQKRMKDMATDAEQAFAKTKSLQAGTKAMVAGSPFRFIAEASLDAVKQHTSVAGQVDLNTWAAQSIERSVATVQSNTQQGLAVLATVGSTAPFVGLFGTVWGIYNALVKIGASGQASIDKVAGPVGEALIMTAIGLAVAVPAVLGYNWLVRRNKLGMDAVRAFGSDLHTSLLMQADRDDLADAAAAKASSSAARTPTAK